ncbi:hypothetical protein [Rhizobium sp. FKY42]|uniref:hypothetical protein n=1 Tax=Rhizobium sp. FKY42 TaxID=2562310 RepID=UPI0010C10739|nr:hypothetical protein [Rhizobium sp. FKY42]
MAPNLNASPAFELVGYAKLDPAPVGFVLPIFRRDSSAGKFIQMVDEWSRTVSGYREISLDDHEILPAPVTVPNPKGLYLFGFVEDGSLQVGTIEELAPYLVDVASRNASAWALRAQIFDLLNDHGEVLIAHRNLDGIFGRRHSTLSATSYTNSVLRTAGWDYLLNAAREQSTARWISRNLSRIEMHVSKLGTVRFTGIRKEFLDQLAVPRFLELSSLLHGSTLSDTVIAAKRRDGTLEEDDKPLVIRETDRLFRIHDDYRRIGVLFTILIDDFNLGDGILSVESPDLFGSLRAIKPEIVRSRLMFSGPQKMHEWRNLLKLFSVRLSPYSYRTLLSVLLENIDDPVPGEAINEAWSTIFTR